ncbi:MAG: hypothetical protein HYZ73_08645, partial [Elusimicrobia bacterium]|nr:hypothetical protein [Elusimicrobiota bacterium]
MKKIIKATTSLWVVAGVLGLATFVHLYDRAFPEAAIQFAKSRGEILGQAKRFLEAQRPSLEGYSESLIFTNDAQARIFLERTLGLTEANALTRTRVKVWAWQGRWFRPLHKEEYQVSIAPDGELIGYTHLVEEATPGTYLEADAAQALAVQWLAEHLGLDISGYQLIDEDYTERPHRSDHTFVWEEPGFNVQGATYRTRVTVAGDQVVEFSKFLKVPERWIQQYTQEQSKGYVTTVLLTGGYGLLGIAVLWVFLGALKRQLPKWRLAACVAGGLAMVQISSTLNAWPLAKHGLQTTQGMGSAYVWLVTQAILTGLTTALQVGITAIAGWFLAQQVWGKGPAAQLIPAFTRQGTRSLLQSTVVGYGLAGVHLAYVSVFYLASFR